MCAYEQLPGISLENVTQLYEAVDYVEYSEVMMSCKDFMQKHVDIQSCLCFMKHSDKFTKDDI